MKLIALTDTPQGQSTGQIFEATDDAARVLIQVGCAKPYVAPVAAAPSSLPDVPTSQDDATAPRRRYRTRQLTAED
jgi:hypothetical protein